MIIAEPPTERTNNPYADLATYLHAIADCITTIDPDGLCPHPWLLLNIQPGAGEGDDEDTKVRTLDAFAQAILGKPAEDTYLETSQVWHHCTHGAVGPVHVAVYGAVTPPELKAKDVELARLRAQRDDFRAAAMMYAATVDDLRRQIGLTPEQVAAAALTPDPAVA